MKKVKCEKCYKELHLEIPYSELDWYKCLNCKRDIVIIHKNEKRI